MEKRITRFNVHKTAATVAVLMALATLPFLLLMGIPALFAGKGGGGHMIMVFVFPLFYLVFSYIFVAFWCWIYNVLIRKTRLGIVIHLDDPA